MKGLFNSALVISPVPKLVRLFIAYRAGDPTVDAQSCIELLIHLSVRVRELAAHLTKFELLPKFIEALDSVMNADSDEVDGLLPESLTVMLALEHYEIITASVSDAAMFLYARLGECFPDTLPLKSQFELTNVVEQFIYDQLEQRLQSGTTRTGAIVCAYSLATLGKPRLIRDAVALLGGTVGDAVSRRDLHTRAIEAAVALSVMGPEAKRAELPIMRFKDRYRFEPEILNTIAAALKRISAYDDPPRLDD